MSDCHAAAGIEAEFEPGSRGWLLRNLRAITRVLDMQFAESRALEAVQEWTLGRFDAEHRFGANDVAKS